MMRRIVLAFGIVFGLACGKESVTAPIADLAGTWNLSTVNGSALPFTLAGSGPDLTVEMVDDQIVAYGDGIWVRTTTYRRTDVGGITTFTEIPSGRWFQTGANVTLNYGGGTTVSARISGDVITFYAPGVVFVYERE